MTSKVKGDAGEAAVRNRERTDDRPSLIVQREESALEGTRIQSVAQTVTHVLNPLAVNGRNE